MRFSSRTGIAATGLVVLHVMVAAAGFFAPYHYSEQNRDLPLSPPMRLHWLDGDGRWHFRPHVYAWETEAGPPYREDRSREYAVRFFVRGTSYRLLGVIPGNLHLFGVDGPGKILLLGTDTYGRDCFSRLLWGGQVSLGAGLLGLTLSLSVALAMGGLSGYYGGWLDEMLMRFSELFLALPWLYLLFAVRAFLPLDLGPAQTFLLITALLGLVGWARPMRLVRGVVLAAKEQEYVGAARGFGASDLYLLRQHILPQTKGVLLTQAALAVPAYILAEVTLSFVGLGVAEPLPSWGNMLAALQQYHVLATSGWMFAPGLALVAVTWLYHSMLSSGETHATTAAA